MPQQSVKADLANGTAVLDVADLPQKDYHDIPNALVGGGPQPRPGFVSFTVQWTAVGDLQHFDNPDQRYRGDLRPANAQMGWSARTPEYEFRSHPLATSVSESALVGFERNGSFY